MTKASDRVASQARKPTKRSFFDHLNKRPHRDDDDPWRRRSPKPQTNLDRETPACRFPKFPCRPAHFPPKHCLRKLPVTAAAKNEFVCLAGRHGLDPHPHGFSQHLPVWIHWPPVHTACAIDLASIAVPMALVSTKHKPNAKIALGWTTPLWHHGRETRQEWSAAPVHPGRLRLPWLAKGTRLRVQA